MQEKQEKNRKVLRATSAATAVGMAALLCACDKIPKIPYLDFLKPSSAPQTYDVTAIAAPRTPQEQALEVPPVHCRVSKGVAHFTPSHWLDFQTADFTVTPEMNAMVTLYPKSGNDTLSFQAYFDDEGQKMIFCPIVAAPSGNKVACLSIYALEDDLNDGIKRTFDIPNAVQGGVLTCANDSKKLNK